MKKYVSLSKLAAFLDKLKTTFASLNHTHKLSDITDYTIDTALSDTSTNPVQNKVLNEEFDSIATAMNALEAAVDEIDVNPDWSQNDSTAKDYIKNRIVYKDKAGSVTIGGGTMSAESESNILTLSDESFTGFVEGESYGVTVDGVTDEYIAQDGAGIVMVVSTDLADAENATDLWWLYFYNGHLLAGARGLYVGKTISVERYTYDVKKLPDDLLPNSVANTYETKTDASSKLNEAKSYTDSKFASLANTAYQIGGDEPTSGPILWFEMIS